MDRADCITLYRECVAEVEAWGITKKDFDDTYRAHRASEPIAPDHHYYYETVAKDLEAIRDAFRPVPVDPCEPKPGTWAWTARMMARGDNSGFDWDAWKDEMKERDMY